MSSSVFIESPPSTPDCSGGVGAITGSGGNLVVVYGKNGINVDRQGLKNLIDEKKLTSISVVRITSPTPSMEEAESENEDAKKPGNIDSDKDESEDDEANEDDELLATLPGKVKKPEVVGLHVEEFYLEEDANKLAKQVLDYAGVVKPPVGFDLEFHRYIIRNDHCYTPYTSDDDSKTKVEKKVNEKNPVQATLKQIKQIVNKNLKKVEAKRKSIDKPVKKEDDGDDLGEEEEEYDSDYSENVSSAETDNDRDSDLDFDLYNRNGRKRKNPKKMKKIPKTERKLQEVCAAEIPRNTKSQFASRVNRDSTEVKKSVAMSPIAVAKIVKNSEVVNINTPRKVLAPPVTVQATPTKMTHTTAVQATQNKQLHSPAVQTTPIKQLPISTVQATPTKQPLNPAAQATPSKQPHTPSKGGFTDISTLIMRPDSTNVNMKVVLKPPPEIRPSKGFMPIVPDGASTSQLPQQISIQTHQSSSKLPVQPEKLHLIDSTELAAEDDKQLDLIDSIVKDQMERSAVVEKTMNENIPKLVKMLESTEQTVLDKSKNPSATPSTSLRFSTGVEDIDIANAPLLDSAEDDLTEDFLKDVAELMKEQEFKEVVEKQVLNSNEPEMVLPATILNTEPKLGPYQIHQQPPRKSLIETSVSNISQVETDLISGMTKTTPLPTRKEPIQIVRGNGRVITLPPIEAPTTRAKRRAQVNPVGNSSPISIASSENLEISGSTEIGQIITYPRRSTSDVEQSVIASPRSRGSTDSKATPSIKKRGVGARKKLKQIELETESQEEDEDDPNKLWCICRQPHNNRFMICCDDCQGWFHGTCVNITKAMGLDMEKKGIEYKCPNCVKAIEKIKQQELLEQSIVAIVPESEVDPVVTETSIITPLPQKPKFVLVQPSIAPTTTSTPTIIQISDTTPARPLKKQVIEIRSVQTITPAKAVAQPIEVRPAQAVNISQVQVVRTADGTKTIRLNRSLPNMRKANPMKQTTLTAHVQPRAQIQIVPDSLVHTSKVQVVAKTTAPKIVHIIKPSAVEKVEDVGENCIICAKKTKSDSIYCSEECIKKHVNTSMQKVGKLVVSEGPISPSLPGTSDDKKKKAKGRFEDLLLLADTKPKAERVFVYERKSGRIFTGSNAPTTLNLKKWLQDNPTFEVVQPGSPQAAEIERIKRTRTPTSTPNESLTSPNTPVKPPPASGASLTPTTQQTLTRFIKITPDPNKSGAQLRTSTPKTLSKYPQHVTIKPDRTEKPSTSEQKVVERVVRKAPAVEKTASKAFTSTAEPIRSNAKRTLKEQLIARMEEIKDESAPKLSLKETEEFATKTETEMYILFNKDTGAKYKAKYRSLMFNIKDRKNETLFHKICAREIDPKQLVRMTPEELASQELAQWRQNENKHQLEMIKKSELDLLSCAKNYVLKTHKGEEVMEAKEADRLNLDITIPVEDVVSVLNNSAVSSSSEANTTAPKPVTFETSFENDSLLLSRSRELSPERKKSTKEKEKEREKRHRSKDRHKDKSRKRSRSRSRERRHKSPHRETEKKDKEREKREKESKTKTTATSVKKTSKTPEPKVESFSLIDKILESSKTVEEAANLGKDKVDSKQKPTGSRTAATPARTLPDLPLPPDPNSPADSDQEPSSTVMIATPPQNPYQKYSADSSTIMWSGNINMVDVATFQIMIQSFAGNTNKMAKDFSNEMNIVGRIHNGTVWEYLPKLRLSPNKEIVLLRLIPLCDSEEIGYTELFTYLHQRDRLGVVKVASPNIKDFYIMPLGADDQMPKVLSHMCTLDDDDSRPDLLFAIIVRIMTTDNASGSKRNSVILKRKAAVLGEGSEQQFTPPGSPKRRAQSKRLPPTRTSDDIDVDAIIKAPIIAKQGAQNISKPVVDDDDEPYSPGGSYDSSGEDNAAPPASSSSSAPSAQKELEEINRQIAARAKDLVDIYKKRPPGSLPPPPAAIVPSLANISLPANLSQILANINKMPAQQSFPNINADEEYVPEPITAYKPSTSSTGSRLGQLSEAELLSLVPDEESDVLQRKRPRWDDPPPPPGAEDDEEYL